MPNTLLTTTPSFLRTLCNLRWVAIVGQAVTVLVALGPLGIALPRWPLWGGIGALALFGGALVSSYVCQWWPGVEAPAWKLWLVAVFANPVMLAALGFMAVDWACFVGTQRGWGCFVAALAILVAALCVLPPVGGLLWRSFKRWRAPAA